MLPDERRLAYERRLTRKTKRPHQPSSLFELRSSPPHQPVGGGFQTSGGFHTRDGRRGRRRAVALHITPPLRVTWMSGEEVSSNPVDTTYESTSNIAMTRDTEVVEAVGRTSATATPEVNQNPGTNANDNENDAEAFQPKKRQKKSPVWLSFKEILVGTVKMAECLYCKSRFRMATSGAISHLKRHADKCLRKPGNLVDKNQQQLSLTATINNAESVTAVQNFKYDHAKMRQVISHWIILTEKSLSTADHEMFTLMMKTANPLYQRIRRSTTTGDIFSKNDIFKGKVKELLKNVQRMSLTTDMWTSNQTMQYMVVTGHFIDKNWKLQKRILNFCGVPPPHTGIVLAGALHKCLVDWDVEAKIWSITLDNASNNDVVVRHLKSMLTYTRRLPLDGDLFHVRCGAHIINIMVQYGLKEIEDTIESVRQSVKHIAASEGRISMFRDIAKQLRLSPKKLILDCSTRWNSTHHMLSVALELKAVFPQYAAQESGYKWLPSDEDWSKVSKVCKFLGLFSYITTIISGSSYPTINLLLPELWNIKTLLNETMESEDERMKVMASKMLEKFDKYWGACNLLITIATILDPRNKFRFVEVSFKDLYSEDNYYTNVNLVREKLYALYNEYVEEYKERNIDSQSEEGGWSYNDKWYNHKCARKDKHRTSKV